ncbi:MULTISPECIES: hypothetical protein [unclassified Mucilaginibacter]|uniref:hypothetical protein n=1 Tax=unclassified Mucilaginibacter TaxID=2617802 RepID=UPI000A58DE89|nr:MULTISPECIES: hypothetical protein [unclassified Mucilaginibacter]PLW89662.1 MAG: hypothetical protein C0154_10300 [Mucilaginibacter sp.]PMP65158.1 MAG: hypothetical protein C0191_04270 [Mucilaginibacter sp.]HEK21164.1 hypothetical protein [Bacteroidota bacterium]
MKRLCILLLVLVCGLSACKKNKGGCAAQVCTDEFASVGIVFTNSDGSAVALSDIEVINLRTNKPVQRPPMPPAIDYVPGLVLLANDNTKAEFSSKGDDVRITVKSSQTGKVKSVTLKIAGGCNCHVSKLSGPDTVAFD